jgi:hypothetical protein
MKQEEIVGQVYKYEFKMPISYIKYKEPVYEGYEPFSFD